MRPLPRRTLLKGLFNTALALPFLEAMIDNRARGQTAIPKRFVLGFGGHSLGAGSVPLTRYQIPAQPGALPATLPEGLASLQAVRDLVTVVTGLKIPTAYDNGGTVPPGGKVNNHHAYMMSPLLSGVSSNAVGFGGCRGTTADQLAGDSLGAGSKFKTLVTCVQPSTYITTDAWQPISWRLMGATPTPILPQTSPRALWSSLFSTFVGPDPSAARAAVREQAVRSLVVDRVKVSSDRLMRQLGQNDRQRLAQHLQEVRELEGRINATQPQVPMTFTIPADPGADPTVGGSNPVVNGSSTYNVNNGWSDETTRGNLMADLIAMALATDLTRSVNFQVSLPQCFINMNSINGSGMDVHAHSHNGVDQMMAKAISWHLRFTARLIAKLAAIPEGGGTVLDSSAVVYTSEGGLGFSAEGNAPNSSHSTENMMVVVGGKAGGLRLGQHLACGNRNHPAQAILTALKAVGYAPNQLGEVSGLIPGLL